MSHRKDSALVLALAEALISANSWSGETHVQKSLFMAQGLLHVPTSFEFILYKYGPFSFELRDALSEMRADDLIVVRPRPPYGPSLIPTDEGEELMASYPNTINRYRPQLEWVANWLGPKGIFDLEEIATALYVLLPDFSISDETAAETISAIKPHISHESALQAVAQLREKIDEIRDAGLILDSA